MNTEVKLKVSKTVKEKGQKQITISGMPARSDKAHLSIKKSITNTIKFKYNNKGVPTDGELVVGDTHGIHRGHQNEEGQAHFDYLYTKLSEPQIVGEGDAAKTVNPLGREIPLKVEVTENTGGDGSTEDLAGLLES